MKRIISIVLIIALLLSFTACGKKELPPNVGGWNTNNGQVEDSDIPEDEGIDVPQPDHSTTVDPNGVTVRIIEYVNKHMIYEVVNNTDTSYKWINVDTYFMSDPLPGRNPVPDEWKYDNGFDYHNGYNFFTVPANSTTYFLCHAFGEEMDTNKGADSDGMVYFPFDIDKDEYLIEIDWEDSQVSDKPIQNARDYLEFDDSKAEAPFNKLGVIKNKSKKYVEFSAFVRFNNHEFCEVINGSEKGGSSVYSNIIPPKGKKIEIANGEYFDLNTLYTDPYDFEETLGAYHVFINAWFVDEDDIE